MGSYLPFRPKLAARQLKQKTIQEARERQEAEDRAIMDDLLKEQFHKNVEVMKEASKPSFRKSPNPRSGRVVHRSKLSDLISRKQENRIAAFKEKFYKHVLKTLNSGFYQDGEVLTDDEAILFEKRIKKIYKASHLKKRDWEKIKQDLISLRNELRREYYWGA